MKTKVKNQENVRECEKCYLVSRFIEKCAISSGIKPSFIKGMMEINYECCGHKFEDDFRSFVVSIFDIYAENFQDNCSLDKNGFLQCLDLGTMLNYITKENFDINGFFNLEDQSDSD